jgi:hypothetical protein
MGMRLPELDELLCMCANKSSLPGGYAENRYWSNTFIVKEVVGETEYGTYTGVHFSNCSALELEDAYDRSYIKCVK